MYANLEVTIREHGKDVGEIVYAWDVQVKGATATIFLDGQSSGGKYAEPIGERHVDLMTHYIRIGANF